MFGTPDASTALVILALGIAILFGLLSYHYPQRNYYGWGVGILILASSLALLLGALGRPGFGVALALILASVTVMLVLLTYQSATAAHAVWWSGVALFFLALPFMGAGRGDLALFALMAGPGLLMLVAVLQPEVPVTYARMGATDVPATITAEEIAVERQRYTNLAAGIAVISLAGVWLSGGVPRREVLAAPSPVVVDEQLAAQGQVLFQQYGCAACHSVTGQAGVGPTIKGLINKQERMTNGTVVLANEEYIRESISQPDAKTVNSYSAGVMNSAISGNLSDIRQPNNLNALVEYIKSLK